MTGALVANSIINLADTPGAGQVGGDQKKYPGAFVLGVVGGCTTQIGNI